MLPSGKPCHKAFFWLTVVLVLATAGQRAYSMDYLLTVKNNTTKTVECHTRMSLDFEASTSGQPPFTLQAGQSRQIGLYFESPRQGRVLSASLVGCVVKPNFGPELGWHQIYPLKLIFNPEGLLSDIANDADQRNKERTFELGSSLNNRYYSIYSSIKSSADHQHLSATLVFEKVMSRRGAATMTAIESLTL
jgi:hypothetical protein